MGAHGAVDKEHGKLGFKGFKGFKDLFLYKIALCGQRQAGCMVKFKVNYSYLPDGLVFHRSALSSSVIRLHTRLCSVIYISYSSVLRASMAVVGNALIGTKRN